MRMPLFLCISSSYQHCIQPPIEATIMYHHLYMYWSAPMFWALIPLFIHLALLRAWVCLHRPYTCHTFVSHPFFRTHNKKPDATIVWMRKLHFSPSLSGLHCCHHYSHDPMMCIGHTMKYFPHTLAGNLLTQKSVHLFLHGLNHIHTSYSYHISLTFDLHSCISTKMV